MSRLVINKVEDFITNVDPVDLDIDYVSDIRGFRFDRDGIIGYRDFGSVNRYSPYPPGITIVQGYTLYVPSEDIEYDIIVGYDNMNQMRIFVYDAGNVVWDELTKQIRATILISPFDPVRGYGITNVTDILGTALTLSPSVLRNYIAVNKTGLNINEALFVSDSTDSTFTTLLDTASSGWLSGDTIYFYRMTGILPDEVLGSGRGYDYIQGTSPHVRWLPHEPQNKVTFFYGKGSTLIQGKQPLQIRKSNFTVDAGVSVAGSQIYFYPWYPNVINRKRPIHLFKTADYIGDDATTHPNVPFFIGQTSAVFKFATATGWYIDKAQLTPDFQASGTATVPKLHSDGVVNLIIGEGIQLSLSFSSTAFPFKFHTRFYVTVIYRGADATTFYQESDPIAQVFLKMDAVTGYPKLLPVIKIDLAKLNKSIAGFRFYEAVKNDADIVSNLGNWQDDQTEYIQVKQILLTDSGWTTDATTIYYHQYTAITLDNTNYDQEFASGASTIDGNLGHAVDKNRSYVSPPFGIRAARGQEAVNIFVQDDRTLRLSSYDGAGVHEDDNFPDLSIDNTGRSMKIPLNGKGTVKGLAILGGKVIVFRNSEMEVFYFDNSGSLVNEGIYPVDFWAKDSLTGIGVNDNPLGVAWAGNYGLYYLPVSGGGKRVLNVRQLNFYNGDLLCTDKVTPFVTDTMRQNVIAGWCAATNEIIFQLQANVDPGDGTTPSATEYLSFCYNIENRRCRVRKFSAQSKFFSSRKDNTLTLGLTNGLLKYPNKTSYAGAGHAWEDALTSLGVSAGTGIESRFRINCGQIYSLDPKAVIDQVLFDFIAESTNNSLFEMNFYVNGQSVAYDTLKFRTKDKPEPRKIKPIGQVNRLEVELKLPSLGLSTFKQFEARTIELLYGSQERLGNN